MHCSEVTLTDVYDEERSSQSLSAQIENLIFNITSFGSFRSNKIWFPAINDNRGKINCYCERRRPFFFFLLPISLRDLSVEVLHLGTVPSGLLSVSNPSSRPLTASFGVLPFFPLSLPVTHYD